MSYPGNPSLSEDIRQRVLNTFRQTAALAEEGKREEALLGCEFILRLDPTFDPARSLQERVQGADDAVETADLLALLEGGAPAEQEWDLTTELADLIERRELRTAMQLIEEHAERVAGDDALQRLARTAQDRLEAQPYVQSFLERAATLRQEGRAADAEAEIAKARQLDPTHPELAGSGREAPEAGPPPAQEAADLSAHEGEDRIERLLAEGQEAFDSGHYQDAIDSWSRIFLIDIDHGEANRRIEEARRLKAEEERQVEELYHEAISLWELGTLAKARTAFERVLARDPNHMAAREYLERIEEGERPEPAPAEAAAEAAAEPEPVGPPEGRPATAPRRPERKTPSAARPEAPVLSKRRLPALPRPAFWVIGAVVLVGVLAAAWLLYSRRDGLFPNSGSGVQDVRSPDVLAAARALQEQGETAQAISRLRAIPQNHPQHAEAQALIAQWETLLEEPADDIASDEEIARRAVLVAQARTAADEELHLRAVSLLDEAAEISPLSEEEAALAAASRESLSGLERAIERFQQGDWEYALPDLWRAREADPANRTVARLIVDSYYNLAVRDLQRRDLVPAREKLDEASSLAPQDAEIRRLVRFVDLYRGQELDLRYRIFVKYLPFR